MSIYSLLSKGAGLLNHSAPVQSHFKEQKKSKTENPDFGLNPFMHNGLLLKCNLLLYEWVFVVGVACNPTQWRQCHPPTLPASPNTVPPIGQPLELLFNPVNKRVGRRTMKTCPTALGCRRNSKADQIVSAIQYK